MTATALAQELEISERTARRDLEALAMAGIPVYSQSGRGGGWSLVGGAKTDLSGLTGAEVRTLFLIAGPSAATPEVKAALRKLVRALPETFRAEAEAAASAVVLDPTGWDHHRAEPPAHLGTLQKAVIDGVQVRLSYTARNGTETERIVHPLGLVAKRTVWYLIANTDGRTADLPGRSGPRRGGDGPTGRATGGLRPRGGLAVHPQHPGRAPGDRRRRRCGSTRRSSRHLRAVLGTPMTVARRVVDGRVDVEVRSYSPERIASQLAGFGGRVEVLATAGGP